MPLWFTNTQVCEYTPTHTPHTHAHTRYLHSHGHTWTLQTENTVMYIALRQTHTMYTNSMSTHSVHTQLTAQTSTPFCSISSSITPSLLPMSLPQLTRERITLPLCECLPNFSTYYCCRLPQLPSLCFALLLAASHHLPQVVKDT